ncbi:ABC transporter permease [Nocardioides sp. CER19]|uniref:ABC transporter permease n=1 Tax=Nocardioides sp. CER19 TaxID=3038538 RepID=UPI002449BCA8|nr:ABC transporter permease [Nocardioides sp. CER19]MDH2413088.1 ABC transporter permease [Nocardioides sp. CER19]
MSQTITTSPELKAGADADPTDTATLTPAQPGAGASRSPRRRTPLAAVGHGLTVTLKRVIAVVAFLALWQIAPKAGWVEPAFLPPFTEVVQALQRLAADGTLWTDIVASLHRSLTGFLVANAIAIPLGLLIAWYKTVAEVLSPLLTVFLNTAAVALIPVFTLILGIGDFSKIAMIAYACFWVVLFNTISGARNVDPLLVKSARSLGLSNLSLFRKVVLPAALPAIFTGVRLSGAASMMVLITTEFVGAKAGLGYLIISAENNFQIPEMYAGILTISVIGVGFNYLLLLLERRFSRWRA